MKIKKIINAVIKSFLRKNIMLKTYSNIHIMKKK